MAFWNRWLGSRKSSDGTLELFREMYGGNTTLSGVPINYKTALESTVAFACARVIAQGMSSIPFRLMQKDGQARGPATEHPIFPLIDDAPNEWMTTVELFDTIGMHLTFCGNAFVFKNKVGGRVVELIPVEPGKVVVEFNGGAMTYEIDFGDGAPIKFPASDVWHIRGPSWNGWMGLEGVKLAREAIGLSMAGERHGAKSFTSGARLSGILTTDANMSPEQRAAMRKSWQEIHGGEGGGGVAMMSNGMKFIQAGSSNAEAQWIEGRKYQVEEVCRAFGVMPIMVGYSDKAATYASAEQMFLAHVVHTLGPWHRRLEKSAAVSLLTPAERKDGHYFKFFTQALLRGAAKDRSEFYAKLYSIGVLNPNEIREMEDLNPYEGGEEFRVPLNMIDPSDPKEPEKVTEDEST